MKTEAEWQTWLESIPHGDRATPELEAAVVSLFDTLCKFDRACKACGCGGTCHHCGLMRAYQYLLENTSSFLTSDVIGNKAMSDAEKRYNAERYAPRKQQARKKCSTH